VQPKMQPCTKQPNTPICTLSLCFTPIAVEAQGPLNESARDLLRDVGRRIVRSSGDHRECSFLVQHLSVVVQRFNSVPLHDSFSVEDQPY